MSSSRLIQGLSLKVGPLGEHDRLLTLLSDTEGITRLAVPGARRPRSSLAATSPLNFLELQIGGRQGLNKVRQLTVVHSFNKLGQSIETLSAAQAIAELSLMLVANNDPIDGMLKTVMIHLERLEDETSIKHSESINVLAKSVQSFIHMLALGGYGLPLQDCCRSGSPLDPPLGQWEWRCSFLPEEGFAIGSIPSAPIQLNPSELALLQRLYRPNLPMHSNGNLLGPKKVWLKLLAIVEYWIKSNLSNEVRSLSLLKEMLNKSVDKNSLKAP